MARGMWTVGQTETQARESVLRETPQLEIIRCERIDVSDISLPPVPDEKPFWAVAFEDPDPSKFPQDSDPIGKATSDLRRMLKTMAVDPEALVTSVSEGFECPACKATIQVDLPPDRTRRASGPDEKTYAHCPECGRQHLPLRSRAARPVEDRALRMRARAAYIRS